VKILLNANALQETSMVFKTEQVFEEHWRFLNNLMFAVFAVFGNGKRILEARV